MSNYRAVEQKAKKRSRVQVFSSSDESDAEPEQPSENNKSMWSVCSNFKLVLLTSYHGDNNLFSLFRQRYMGFQVVVYV